MTAYDRTERAPRPPSGVRADEPDGRDGVPRERHERLGPYRLIEEIGEGGMGVVHLALDPRGRAVAIKVLRTHIAHDDDARRRLGREVDTLSRIRDDRVASVIDADIMGPRPYIVTRYVPGPALDETVEEHGPLAPDELLRLARGVAEAIRAIHACGVVHRDIKPGNVLLEDGEPVLIDFGIAHLQDDVRHTVGGLVMGTPGYLSPELVEGAAITDATDWWGWAATITFAASGRPPFGRARMDAVLTRVRAGDVDLDGVDPLLVPLLRAALSPDPARRPHADDVIAALEQYAAGRAATVPPPQGGPWDDETTHVEPPPLPGSTQVLQERSTSVMPPVPMSTAWPPPSHRSAASAPPPAPPAPAGPAPTGGPYAAPAASSWEDLPDSGPLPADDYWDRGVPEDDEEIVPREGDPRIGLPMRTGLLGAAALAWVGALAAWPGIALLVLVGWSVIARATDLSFTSLVLRRYERGRRRSDVAMTVLTSPWHLVVGVVATAVSLILPVGVALAGIYGSALLLAGTRGGELGPGAPVTLVVGGALGLAMLWWGPGGASLRRGSRSIVRRLVPPGLPMQVVAGVLATVGVVAGAVAIAKGVAITWNPFSGNPFGG
ncbi:serine/threonine-protein kinase [Humibacillus xanthopallidus]|uniref:serine/threonine-protein kinase n=1 Tax=Humibacillus xanthopallidus TaxID=412689 RepID=UPI00385124ED